MDQLTSQGFNNEFSEIKEPQGPEISPFILGEPEAETHTQLNDSLQIDSGRFSEVEQTF